MGWRAIARCATGTSHQKQQMPCQDYSDYQVMNDTIVGAVADGAGSAIYADIGAHLAVQTALEHLTLEQKHFCKPTPESFSEEEARQIFVKIFEQVVSALQQQAASGSYSVADLACTLLVFVATPNWIAAMQIGDSFIVVRQEKQEHILLFPPNKGEYINETTFVTSANALDAMRVCVRTGKQEFICAATDGLERVAIRMSDWTPFTPFFQPLEDYLRQISVPEQEDKYLMSFLDSDKLNARTDDDKTLLLCLFESEQPCSASLISFSYQSD